MDLMGMVGVASGAKKKRMKPGMTTYQGREDA